MKEQAGTKGGMLEAGQSGSRIDALIRIALVLNVLLDILADIRETDERNKIQWEAVYLLA